MAGPRTCTCLPQWKLGRSSRHRMAGTDGRHGWQARHGWRMAGNGRIPSVPARPACRLPVACPSLARRLPVPVPAFQLPSCCRTRGHADASSPSSARVPNPPCPPSLPSSPIAAHENSQVDARYRILPSRHPSPIPSLPIHPQLSAPPAAHQLFGISIPQLPRRFLRHVSYDRGLTSTLTRPACCQSRAHYPAVVARTPEPNLEQLDPRLVLDAWPDTERSLSTLW